MANLIQCYCSLRLISPSLCFRSPSLVLAACRGTPSVGTLSVLSDFSTLIWSIGEKIETENREIALSLQVSFSEQSSQSCPLPIIKKTAKEAFSKERREEKKRKEKTKIPLGELSNYVEVYILTFSHIILYQCPHLY